MKSTLEVRWFMPGEVPAAVELWFAQFDPERQAPRTDYYMHPGANVTCSIKLRADRVQVKRRLTASERVWVGPGVQGHVERWDKFSFPLEGKGKRIRRYQETDRWVRVDKERAQRVFDAGWFDAHGDGAPSSNGAVPGTTPGHEAHAEVELTRVETGGQTWWSLCLESEGADEALGAVLQRAGAYVFAQQGAPFEHLLQSWGYAEFLSRHCADPQPA